MRRLARYTLAVIWGGMLIRFLPTARDADDALGMVIFVSVLVFFLALIISLAGIIAEAIVGRRG